MTLPEIDMSAHRAFRVLRQRNARDGVPTLSRCLTCGYETEDDDERLDHYPRQVYAAALRHAAEILDHRSRTVDSPGGYPQGVADAAGICHHLADEAAGG